MSLSQAQCLRLNNIPRRIEYLVHGFIHNVGSLLKSLIVVNIPVPIIQLCVLFFFKGEYFEKCGDAMVITGDEMDIVTKRKDSFYDCIVYGANWIPSNTSHIIKWSVKIINDITPGGIIIGIISKEVDMDTTQFWNNKIAFPSYFFMATTTAYSNGQSVNYNYGKEYGKYQSELTMELNLKTQELLYHIDGISYGVAVDHIQKDNSIQYKLIISMYYKFSMKLIDFECIEQ